MFNPMLAIWCYMINPLGTWNTPMSHHEQGEKLGHQTAYVNGNDRMATIWVGLKRKRMMLTKRVSIVLFIFLLVIWKSYLLKTIYYVVFLFTIALIRMADCSYTREWHTSLVYSRFNDSIHTRTVSWLIMTVFFLLRWRWCSRCP